MTSSFSDETQRQRDFFLRISLNSAVPERRSVEVILRTKWIKVSPPTAPHRTDKLFTDEEKKNKVQYQAPNTRTFAFITLYDLYRSISNYIQKFARKYFFRLMNRRKRVRGKKKVRCQIFFFVFLANYANGKFKTRKLILRFRSKLFRNLSQRRQKLTI